MLPTRNFAKLHQTDPPCGGSHWVGITAIPIMQLPSLGGPKLTRVSIKAHSIFRINTNSSFLVQVLSFIARRMGYAYKEHVKTTPKTNH